MDLHEFELRYHAYHGLKTKFILDRDEDTLINLIKISNRWIPDKKIQELSPEELKGITIETYSEFKTMFLSQQGETKLTNTHTLKEYIERLEYELKVIKEMWFNSYFLIVSDFVWRAKDNTIIVWPWRWSWAGSLLAWVIKITDIDPLPYQLLFERFLNPARISMPDFDIDFEDTQRDKVIQYVREKYWANNVSAIGTYMQLATKAAFKDAARALGVPFDKANVFSALIPDRVTLAQALEDKETNKELVALYEWDEKINEAAELSKQLAGNMRQLWVHACGIIIAPQEVSQYTWIQYVQNSDMQVTQYDWPTLEYIWLLKMDFLWLRNLSVIKNCIKIITKKYEKEWKDIPDIFKQFYSDATFLPPLDDEYTYEKVFQAGDTTGIFQFEWSGMRRFLVQLKANSINDLVAMNALYRPWPMEFIPSYIKRKHGEEKVEYMREDLKEELLKKYDKTIVKEETEKLEADLKSILDVTYWIAVYQEQLMFIVQSMAWFSLAEADLLRRWVGKKKKEIIEQLKKEFMKRGAEYRWYKRETAKRVYEKMIEPAASYSFNKSHSVCYALIAYQTAYLKAYFPVAFYAALIRSVEEDTDTLSNFIGETQQHGIQVKNPDINESFNHVAAIDDYVRLGFLSIKGVWFDIGEYIQEERKTNGKYTSLENFLQRCEKVINKKSLEWLTKSWALDTFIDRKTLLENINNTIERSKSAHQMDQWLFWWSQMTQTIHFEHTYKTTFTENLKYEQEVFKSFVSWHPLDSLYPYIKKYNFITWVLAAENWPFKIIGYIKNIQRARKKWFFVLIEDLSWSTEIFLTSTLNLKKFDIVIITWYKWRWLSIDKIIKTSREQLVERAKTAGKYDESFTAIQVKKSRSQEEQKEFIQETLNTIDPQQDHKKEWVEEQTKDNQIDDKQGHIQEIDEEDIQPTTYNLPDNTEKMQKLITIIKENPGDIEITIWSKPCIVSETGKEEIDSLLSKQ